MALPIVNLLSDALLSQKIPRVRKNTFISPDIIYILLTLVAIRCNWQGLLGCSLIYDGLFTSLGNLIRVQKQKNCKARNKLGVVIEDNMTYLVVTLWSCRLQKTTRIQSNTIWSCNLQGLVMNRDKQRNIPLFGGLYMYFCFKNTCVMNECITSIQYFVFVFTLEKL